MNVLDYIAGYGTHEGLLKAWDTRGRHPSEQLDSDEHGAEGFVSPSHEDKDISFDEALKRLNSEEQKQFISQANGLVKQVVGKGEVKSAIGDWKDGAENSSIIVSSSAKPEDMAYITAKLGTMSQQKATLVFGRDRNGADTVWTFEDGPNVNEVRQALDRVGINFRTVIPGNKTEVHIFDQGSKLRDAVGKVAAQFGGDVRFSRGTGDFIGADDREGAKKVFAGIIADYEGRRVQ